MHGLIGPLIEPEPEPERGRIVALRHRSSTVLLGAAVGLISGNYFLGGVAGIVLGIVLSVGKTLYLDRKRRR